MARIRKNPNGGSPQALARSNLQEAKRWLSTAKRESRSGSSRKAFEASLSGIGEAVTAETRAYDAGLHGLSEEANELSEEFGDLLRGILRVQERNPAKRKAAPRYDVVHSQDVWGEHLTAAAAVREYHKCRAEGWQGVKIVDEDNNNVTAQLLGKSKRKAPARRTNPRASQRRVAAAMRSLSRR